jgi:hypothetical protein
MWLMVLFTDIIEIQMKEIPTRFIFYLSGQAANIINLSSASIIIFQKVPDKVYFI